MLIKNVKNVEVIKVSELYSYYQKRNQECKYFNTFIK